jgi:hypothetical protein
MRFLLNIMPIVGEGICLLKIADNVSTFFKLISSKDYFAEKVDIIHIKSYFERNRSLNILSYKFTTCYNGIVKSIMV